MSLRPKITKYYSGHMEWQNKSTSHQHGYVQNSLSIYWVAWGNNFTNGLHMIFKLHILGKENPEANLQFVTLELHFRWKNGSFENNVIFDNPNYTDSGLFSLVEDTLPWHFRFLLNMVLQCKQVIYVRNTRKCINKFQIIDKVNCYLLFLQCIIISSLPPLTLA